MSTPKVKPRFVICIYNKGYKASLELRKIYRVLPEVKAAKSKYLRIIDESGEGYLYPETYFISVALPATVERALLNVS